MKKVISSNNAPKAVGPYSPGIQVKDFLFLSGQVPMSPVTGKLVSGDISQQTEQIMKNLEAMLSEVGATFENVVKTTIFLVDIADYAIVNSTYGRYFLSDPPARSTIQVAALPLGAQVEIEMIAHIP